jgi:hypothetical protein
MKVEGMDEGPLPLFSTGCGTTVHIMKTGEVGMVDVTKPDRARLKENEFALVTLVSNGQWLSCFVNGKLSSELRNEMKEIKMPAMKLGQQLSQQQQQQHQQFMQQQAIFMQQQQQQQQQQQGLLFGQKPQQPTKAAAAAAKPVFGEAKTALVNGIWLNSHFFLNEGNNSKTATIHIRAVQFQGQAMNQQQISAVGFRIFSFWEHAQAEADKKLFKGRTLSAFFKRPPPLWNHPSFLGEFFDPYVSNPSFVSCSIAGNLLVVAHMLRDAAENMQTHLSASVVNSTKAVAEAMVGAELAFRKMGNMNDQFFPRYLQRIFQPALLSLGIGEFMFTPAAQFPVPFLIMIERKSDARFRFVFINTDPESGLVYHPSTGEDKGKLKHKVSIVVDDVHFDKVCF